MAQTIINIGNSQGIILPKEVLDSLNISKGDTVEVTLENGSAVLTPKNGAKHTKPHVSNELLEWLDGFNKRYSSALEELASK